MEKVRSFLRTFFVFLHWESYFNAAWNVGPDIQYFVGILICFSY